MTQPKPSRDKGIHAKETIKGFPQQKEQFCQRDRGTLFPLPLHSGFFPGWVRRSSCSHNLSLCSFSLTTAFIQMPPDKELGQVSLEAQNYCPAMDGLTYHFLERKEKKKKPLGCSQQTDFLLVHSHFLFFYCGVRCGLLFPSSESTA